MKGLLAAAPENHKALLALDLAGCLS